MKCPVKISSFILPTFLPFDILSICIGLLQKPQRPSASPSAFSALKKYDCNANGFDMTCLRHPTPPGKTNSKANQHRTKQAHCRVSPTGVTRKQHT